MKETWQKLRNNTTVCFIAKTIFYFVVIFFLIYLYSYSGINQPHFIYNEFQFGDEKRWKAT